PYIGVNFGVKTLEEEANTAGVVKDKFYQWNESNDYYVSCDCDKDNVRSGRWAFAADSPLVYLGDNWYKINDYLAAKVLLQVKGSSPTAVPFENVGTGGDTRWHICDPGGQRLGGHGASGNSGSFSLKILQPFVGSVVIPPMALARLYECYNIPAGDSCTTTGTPVLVYYLSGTINSLGSCSVNAGETIEVDLGDVFAANFRVVGHKPLGARTVELAIPVRCNTGNAGLVNVNLSLTATTDPSYPQAIKTSRPGVGVVVTDSQNNIISPAGGTLPLSIPDDADSIARMNVYPVSTTGVPPETGRFEATATVRINFD
ncbi:fimbrial protein, partial [Escherichia coli]